MHHSSHISWLCPLNHVPNLRALNIAEINQFVDRVQTVRLKCLCVYGKLPGKTDINSRHSSFETAVALVANGTE